MDEQVAQILAALIPQLTNEQKQELALALIDSAMLDNVPVGKVQFDFLQQQAN